MNKYMFAKIQELNVKANSGDAEAQFELAKRHYQGKGTKKSYDLARQWYYSAASGGNIEACYECAYMMLTALGGEEDLAEAAQLFKKAADGGHREACFELGVMYSLGRGVKKNYVKAMRYLRSAGTSAAASMLESAPEWFKDAASRGITEAEYQYGVCCINAYGVEQDCDEGFKWIYKAALKDHARALDAMSQIYEQGLGVQPDKEKAQYWKLKYCEVTGSDPESLGLGADAVFDTPLDDKPSD